MLVQEYLRIKGTEAHTIGAYATLDDVVLELVRCNVGSLVVMGQGSESTEAKMAGIITERDFFMSERYVQNRWSTDREKLYVDQPDHRDLPPLKLVYRK